MNDSFHDIVIVGGGPAGLAAACGLAREGKRVAVLERDPTATAVPGGDVLTPVAAEELARLGLGDLVDSAHRLTGVRLVAHGRAIDLPWAPDRAVHGSALHRHQLLDGLRRRARELGTDHITAEADTPLVEHGHLVGIEASNRSYLATHVVLADGARSTIGRALGTARDRDVTQGLAMRALFRSERRDADWLEAGVELRDSAGSQLPGFGWAFPLGDGTISVGVAVLARVRSDEELSVEDLFDRWVEATGRRWAFDPDQPELAPEPHRVQIGWSVHPKSGPNWLAIGDAAGAISPLTGDGLHGALYTARLATEALAGRLGTPGQPLGAAYEAALAAEHDDHAAFARFVARVVSQPRRLRRLTALAMAQPRFAEWLVRAASNRADTTGPGIGPVALRLARRIGQVS